MKRRKKKATAYRRRRGTRIRTTEIRIREKITRR